MSGVTSTEKTSIGRAIQELSDEFFYLISSDILRGMVNKKYLFENFFKYECELFSNVYYFAKILSDRGKNVIIDMVLFETPELPNHYQTMRSILENNPLFTVEVVCPLEICRERNIARGDRYADQSAEQDKLVDKEAMMDFSVRTDINTSDECAKMILRKTGVMFH